MYLLPRLYHTPLTLDLAQSHRGRDRGFFVGAYWWDNVHRPISSRLGSQEVKVHGRWHFIRVPGFEEGMIVEVYAVNWFLGIRHQPGSVHRPLGSRGQPRITDTAVLQYPVPRQ